MRLEPFARPDWSPLPFEGCVGVEGKVLVRESGFFFSLLRFEPGGTIHEHPGERDAYVACLEGEGWTSVGEEHSQLRTGECRRREQEQGDHDDDADVRGLVSEVSGA